MVRKVTESRIGKKYNVEDARRCYDGMHWESKMRNMANVGQIRNVYGNNIMVQWGEPVITQVK